MAGPSNFKPKTPAQSAIETRHLLMPHQVNAHGTAFGGVIMSWIDITGAMAAMRHCEGAVVTAGIDQLSFQAPIHLSDQVVLKATVNYVGRTSMEVGVTVLREDIRTGEQVQTTKAYLTFVHVDEHGRPAPVPPLEPQTPEEKRRYTEAKARVAARRKMRGQ